MGVYPDWGEYLKAPAREEGLWNMFLPGLRDDESGTRLTNLEYAPLADFYTGGRALRFAGGPDEVHLQTIARLELRESKDSLLDAANYLAVTER